ncbi:MAG: YbeD family protein [Idiomarina sp.]|nr:YbeD family protein [Idiomarina sp.]
MQTKFDELLEFPCEFTFKAMGVARDDLTDDLVAAVQPLAPGDYVPEEKVSSKGNYLSVTLRVQVTSKDHIESVYKALAAVEGIRHVL